MERFLVILRTWKFWTFIGVLLFAIGLILYIATQDAQENPDYCIPVEDEETGEIIYECPNRDEEAALAEFEEIINELPIRQRYYEIEPETPSADMNTIPVVIRIITREFPQPASDASPDDPLVRQYENHIRENRRAAKERLAELDFNQEQYEVYFKENVLIDEFDGEYVGKLYERTGQSQPETGDFMPQN